MDTDTEIDVVGEEKATKRSHEEMTGDAESAGDTESGTAKVRLLLFYLV